jgi:hypothetical protein
MLKNEFISIISHESNTDRLMSIIMVDFAESNDGLHPLDTSLMIDHINEYVKRYRIRVLNIETLFTCRLTGRLVSNHHNSYMTGFRLYGLAPELERRPEAEK